MNISKESSWNVQSEVTVQLAWGKRIFWFGWHAATDRHCLSMQWASPFSHPLLSCSVSLAQMETQCVHDLPWGCSGDQKAVLQWKGEAWGDWILTPEGKEKCLPFPSCVHGGPNFYLSILFKTGTKAVGSFLPLFNTEICSKYTSPTNPTQIHQLLLQ